MALNLASHSAVASSVVRTSLAPSTALGGREASGEAWKGVLENQLSNALLGASGAGAVWIGDVAMVR